MSGFLYVLTLAAGVGGAFLLGWMCRSVVAERRQCFRDQERDRAWDAEHLGGSDARS